MRTLKHLLVTLIWKAGNDSSGSPRAWAQKITALGIGFHPRPFDVTLTGKRGLVGAEVGVFRGGHAEQLLRRLDIKMLYLVDEYNAYVDYSQDQMDRALYVAKRRLSHYANCSFMLVESGKAAGLCPPLDFVYIDAAHDEASVGRDMRLWWPVVKPGGVMGGHDFDDTQEHIGVLNAVLKFSTEASLRLHTHSPDWWFIKP